MPGNHDAALVRPWLHANGVPASVDAEIPLDATPALAPRDVAGSRRRAVRVHYPGIRLAEGVWATHGHYLDRHLLPEAAFGMARGLLGRLPRDGATPADYEGGPSVTRLEALLTRWLPRPLARLVDDAAELVRATTMPGVHRLLPAPPLRAAEPLRCSAPQMRRAAIPALARVVTGSVSRPTGSSSATSTAAARCRRRSRALAGRRRARCGSSTPARGPTSRCCCTTRRRRTRTGRAARSCSRTAASRRRSGCSTTSAPPRCVRRPLKNRTVVWGRSTVVVGAARITKSMLVALTSIWVAIHGRG